MIRRLTTAALVASLIVGLPAVADGRVEAAVRKPWSVTRVRIAHGGSVISGDQPGSGVTFRVSGPSITLWWVSGPSNGKAAVLVNGRRVTSIDQFSVRPSRRSKTIRGSRGTNVVQVVVLASKNQRSTGTRITVDAFSSRTGVCTASCVRSPRVVAQQSAFDPADPAWYPIAVPSRGAPEWNVAIGSYVRGKDVTPIDVAVPIIRNAACAQARQVVRGVVVLSFGRQVSGGASGFGSTITGPDIVATAAAWANGLAECATGSWEVAIGTSNSGAVTAFNGYMGGREWASLVTAARAAADPRIIISGAVDLEPSWGPPGQARAWVDGWVGASGARLWNFGSADGCPQTVSADLTCNNGWTIDDVLWVSSHAGPNVVAMPQIHSPGGAQSRQWAVLAARANTMGMPLRIAAITVQTAACAQMKGGCPSTGISAWDGWSQIRRTIDAIPAIAGMPIGAPMDIRWGWGEGYVVPPPTTTSSSSTTSTTTSTTPTTTTSSTTTSSTTSSTTP